MVGKRSTFISNAATKNMCHKKKMGLDLTTDLWISRIMGTPPGYLRVLTLNAILEGLKELAAAIFHKISQETVTLSYWCKEIWETQAEIHGWR
jgi:hypothetical protein